MTYNDSAKSEAVTRYIHAFNPNQSVVDAHLHPPRASSLHPTMAAEVSRKKKSRFACKCLNVQIKASKPVGPVPAELATEPGFTQVYVKHDGISAVSTLFLWGRMVWFTLFVAGAPAINAEDPFSWHAN